MGYMHIEGEPLPLVRFSAVSSRPPAPRCTSAMNDALAEIEVAGRKVRRQLVKNAARLYRDRPQLLDAIRLGLSDAHPAFILAAVEQKAGSTAWGRIDMFGVVPVNLAGAALYARWLRLAMRREARATREVAHA